MINKSFPYKRFRNIGVLTVVAVYFLILVGGIVRSTGSGMGCPDWPKCFGSWVPPTDVSQLPDNYLEVYKEQRVDKNQKLAGFLDKIGFDEVAGELRDHPLQHIETDFNVTKTWIEYINRLVGVVIGILIFLTVVYAIPYLKTDKSVFYLSLLSFVLVGFQGWLGSIVVSTNLLPVTITIHMALALVIVALLQYAVIRSQAAFIAPRFKASKQLLFIIVLVALATFAQILIGTQVREEVDVVAFEMNGSNRDLWVDQLGLSFYIHRSFSILLLAMHLYMAYLIYKLKDRQLNMMTNWMMVLLVAEIAFGIIMAYFAIPAFLQPLHLTIATLLFGVQFLILIFYYYASRKEVQKPVVVLN
ncbi:COX15/CtaA family protein [Pontibacter ramchanderi]|uniref:Cytochrome c oxidase assembly protein subunit 15 n=1 Tax=Pontibacter ramchanderi TaxID=1179743 RepID=A0A2N3UA59_9BACT|nr:COX15/CtaA family protein [Pontibacter ramchanderi]PKV66290.1 cytochrome c oxidase assembly protein subunit 15 [Pontibacter ramchanderi]